MSIIRVHTKALPTGGGLVTLDPTGLKHLHVLRAKVGQKIELFDGEGKKAQATLTELTADSAQCQAEEPELEPEEPYVLGLIQVLPKAGKMDGMVRMATEIGVSEIHVVLAEHSVATPDRKSFEKRRERLERIAEQAARQSGRSRSPVIHPLGNLIDAAQSVPEHALRVLFWEKSDAPLCQALVEAPKMLSSHTPLPVWAVVGAEGGISDREAETLTSLGFAQATMGPHILRVETAAPVACALLLEGLRRSGRARYHSGA